MPRRPALSPTKGQGRAPGFCFVAGISNLQISTNDGFSVAMFDYRRVYPAYVLLQKIKINHCMLFLFSCFFSHFFSDKHMLQTHGFRLKSAPLASPIFRCLRKHLLETIVFTNGFPIQVFQPVLGTCISRNSVEPPRLFQS